MFFLFCHRWTLALVLAGFSSVACAGEAEQRAELAVLVRQLDGLERQAERGAAIAESTGQQDGVRYHFDYARLREDVRRVRTGIQDYLTPQRAQPRDPVELMGNYRNDVSRREAP
ncbi:raqprd family integrative conjugative element protein [Paraburkholderia sp. Ac-20342]|uniref:integrative conjugative element protein, RAQPRD family n=1 Tax=Paraburkholderia sp. Ac-20342 TaxID=2703889 RepID=UPI00197E3137|nr:RAQPRD family integrative conjugative element protein [Paraburkholderia sp. Ac-20342]MBN3848538.1 raqprd family integrative conjugative element protein [Paraburkholderia sp. Ac-20342]